MISCKQEAKHLNVAEHADQGEKSEPISLETYDFETLQSLLETDSDSIYVVNFWATWCAPCIEELPYFEKINRTYADNNVKVILVSLDFPKKYESHLKPFISRNNLRSRVIALDDPNSNIWIPKIDANWSGAIPATLIFSKNERRFYEQTFTYEGLESALKPFLIKTLN